MASTFMDETFSFLPARYRRKALSWIIGGLVLLFTTLGSLLLYDSVVEARNEEVSGYYWQLTSAVDKDEIALAEEALTSIKERGTDEQYCLAAMVLAAGAFSNDDVDKAEGLYREVIDLSDHRGIRDTARTRLAKVLLAKGEYAEAKQELITVESLGVQFSVVVSDLLGDISIAEGDFSAAASHYREGLSLISERGNEQLTSFLQSKIAMITSLRLQGAVK